jgi:signal transduction histidine kinase/CheY-like chemotaxis protein
MLVAGVGTLVLLGWLFDVALAKSVMAGWRVMVPVTAACFVLTGVAIVLTDRALRGRDAIAARVVAAVAVALPLLTFIEYLTGLRTGLEGWFGVSFDAASPVAGRMSPLTSLCFAVLDASLLALTLPGHWALMVARVAAGATLLTSWLAITAVAFDSGRLADVPVFPGMALMTIALMAIASWASLALSFERDTGPQVDRAPGSPRIGALLAVAFTIPLLLGVLRDATAAWLGPQLVTAVLVLLLAAAMAAIIWQYGSRMSALRRDRERAFAELEQRVTERTSELAARNAELKRTEDRLRDADRRKDEFLAMLAHELRNPLAPIRSAVAVLRSELVSEDGQHEARVIIERQVAQMSRLIDDLLDVSRITAGKLPMKKSPLPLAAVLNLAISTVRPHIDGAGHRLTVSLPNEPLIVDADEARLSQVFANLLHNACKYTESNGEIIVAASLPNEDEVEVAVRDNGIGIPTEFLPRLFDKFSQLAPARDRSQGGLGLGLSLVSGIVALHDGRIEARSAGPGRGSEFVIRLPLLQGETLPGPITLPAAAAGQIVSRRVLVVDDNADSAESLALLLRLEGHLVETAHDGETAVELAERFQPEAILLDLGMPGMNGFEVCEQIRTQPWAQSVLMVAQTGWGQAQDRARTLDAGFDAHLTKPIDPATVQEMLVTLKVHG